MRGRDSVEFTGALALGAVVGAVLALLWRRLHDPDHPAARLSDTTS